MKKTAAPLPSLIALLLISVSISARAGLFGADTYHECLLDELADVETDEAAVMVANQCLADFPDMKLPEKSPSLLFGPNDSEECLEDKAREHPSSAASTLISEACYLVYPAKEPEETEAP